MGFHEVLFPTDISYGSRGGPGFSTSIITLDSGHEERVARWSGTGRRTYDAAYGVKTQEQIATLTTFFIARLGSAFGFRYKDFADFTTGANHTGAVDDGDVLIATADGTTTTFQLGKRYTSGGVTRVRNITKPVAGTLVIAVNGAAVTTGWTLNTTTGIVTFSTAPTDTHDVTAGFEFDVPVRFGEELDEGLAVDIAGYENRDVRSIPIVEILDEGIVSEEFAYRGSKVHGIITADVAITPLEGFTHTFAPATAGHACILPAAASVPTGGPHFIVSNQGSESLAVEVPGGTVLVTLAAAASVILFTAFDTPNYTWYST